MKIFTLSICICICTCAFSQASLTQWDKTIGGSDFEVANYIRHTADSGYIIGGFSRSIISGDKTENKIGGDDFWVVKIDADANIQWQNTIGGYGNDDMNCVEQTTDGGYILAGSSYSGISGDKTNPNKGGSDYWVIKLDATGNIVWQKTFGGNQDDNLLSLQQTSDGGYILAGSSYSGISSDKTVANFGNADYWVIKLDASGNILWQKALGGDRGEDLRSVRQTADGGYILGGSSYSGISGNKTQNNYGVSEDYWVVKINATGDIIWQKTIGGLAGDVLQKVIPTADGYVAAGYSFSKNNGLKTENNISGGVVYPDYWIVGLDTAGNILWQNTIGGTLYDYLHDILPAADGGYLLAGYSGSGISGDKTEPLYGGAGDYWLVKTDAGGNVLWENTIGGDGNDGLFCLDVTPEGGYILSGKSYSNISYDKTQPNQGDADYWILKLFPEGCTVQTYFADADADGYGNASVTTSSCAAPAGFVSDSSDCNDAAYAVHPGTFEICNSLDDNCNGVADEATTLTVYAEAEGSTSFCHGGDVELIAEADAGGDLTYQWYRNGTMISGATASIYYATKQGNYKARVTNSCGVSSNTGVINITVYENPGTTLSPGGPLDLCVSGSVTLNAPTGPSYTYAWFKNNILMSGVTGSTFIATSVGNYKVKTTNINGCTKSSSVITVFAGCKQGTEELPEISVYPNPVTTELTLDMHVSGIKEIRISDAIGNIINTISTTQEVYTLHTENMEEGLYFISLNADNIQEVKEFMKIK